MRDKIEHWLWNQFLGPRNKRRFAFRIWLRVEWLYFRRWLRESFTLAELVSLLTRPVMLLAVGVGLPLGIASLWGISFAPDELLKRLKAEDSLDLKEIIRTLLVFIGLPSAFILWAFRDANAKANLENQRKDINLKEFQEIQMRAAGALDEKLPALARQTLQIAAIHQLRPFLRGEYGESFRRPAWELLRARLATSAAETGEAAISDWIEQGAFPREEGETDSERAKRIVAEVRRAIDAINPGPVTLAERALISEEASRLFRKDLPLQAGHFDGVGLVDALLAGRDFSNAFFVGAILREAHLEGADLRGAHLEGAILREAHLEGAKLIWAHLEGADLIEAHLEGAKLIWAHLEGASLMEAHLEGASLMEAHLESADLRWAHLEGADLGEAHLEGADLRWAHLEGALLFQAHLEGADLRGTKVNETTRLFRAVYDDATIFADDWRSLSPEARDEARAPWRALGMIHVSEVKR